MHSLDQYDVIAAGEGRWDIQLRDRLSVVGYVWRTGAGFIAWVVVRSLAGKAKEISPLLWIVAAGFVLYFARGPLEVLLAA